VLCVQAKREKLSALDELAAAYIFLKGGKKEGGEERPYAFLTMSIYVERVRGRGRVGTAVRSVFARDLLGNLRGKREKVDPYRTTVKNEEVRRRFLVDARCA